MEFATGGGSSRGNVRRGVEKKRGGWITKTSSSRANHKSRGDREGTFQKPRRRGEGWRSFSWGEAMARKRLLSLPSPKRILDRARTSQLRKKGA